MAHYTPVSRLLQGHPSWWIQLKMKEHYLQGCLITRFCSKDKTRSWDKEVWRTESQKTWKCLFLPGASATYPHPRAHRGQECDCWEALQRHGRAEELNNALCDACRSVEHGRGWDFWKSLLRNSIETCPMEVCDNTRDWQFLMYVHSTPMKYLSPMSHEQ